MEWYQILVLIFVIMIVVYAIGFLIYGSIDDKWNVFIPMPRDFKDNTEMNWFGCVVCYIFLFILFPIFNICKLIYWLFHV